MKIIACVNVAALGIAALTVASATAQQKEGNWEVTIKMQMEGMPTAMPPMTTNQCVTAKDLVPDLSQGSAECSVREQKKTGDTVSWKMVCDTKEMTVAGEGRIKYAVDRYEGQMQAKMTPKESGGYSGTMSYVMQGRYTGPCSASSKKAKRADDY